MKIMCEDRIKRNIIDTVLGDMVLQASDDAIDEMVLETVESLKGGRLPEFKEISMERLCFIKKLICSNSSLEDYDLKELKSIYLDCESSIYNGSLTFLLDTPEDSIEDIYDTPLSDLMIIIKSEMQKKIASEVLSLVSDNIRTYLI